MEGGGEVLQAQGRISPSWGSRAGAVVWGKVLSGGPVRAGHLNPGPLGGEVLQRGLLQVREVFQCRCSVVLAQVLARTCSCCLPVCGRGWGGPPGAGEVLPKLGVQGRCSGVWGKLLAQGPVPAGHLTVVQVRPRCAISGDPTPPGPLGGRVLQGGTPWGAGSLTRGVSRLHNSKSGGAGVRAHCTNRTSRAVLHESALVSCQT